MEHTSPKYFLWNVSFSALWIQMKLARKLERLIQLPLKKRRWTSQLKKDKTLEDLMQHTHFQKSETSMTNMRQILSTNPETR